MTVGAVITRNDKPYLILRHASSLEEVAAALTVQPNQHEPGVYAAGATHSRERSQDEREILAVFMLT